MARKVLKTILQRLNFNPEQFNLHSTRIGHAVDLLKAGYTIEEIKRLGRWKSNAVFRYLKDL